MGKASKRNCRGGDGVEFIEGGRREGVEKLEERNRKKDGKKVKEKSKASGSKEASYWFRR